MQNKLPIPVIILTGFLGSGKTTLINHLLKTSQNKKFAIIENEFGEINIDEINIKRDLEKMIQQ
ncbi:GTP-binding protein [Alkalitalea saponilacus]|nr:GTP-binding protein [Alkalitalea saponilacus]ASB49759.1 hypothetical protein CDL62_11730 [Alkalitalea saponilacus]